MASTPNRIYYAVEAVAITSAYTGITVAAMSGDAVTTIHGVQSISMGLNFNVEYITELGQLDTYSANEDRPDVSCTIEKVMDGYPLIYHVATADTTGSGLSTRTASRCTVFLGIWNDVDDDFAANDPGTTVIASGAFIDSLDYTFGSDGSFTESITFSANDRVWNAGDDWFGYQFDGTDSPQNAFSSVLRRQHLIMGIAGDLDTKWSRLPTDIPNIDANGYNPYNSVTTTYDAHINSIGVSTSLGRTDLFELGTKGAWYRYANFPVDVTCAIEVGTTQGDQVGALADARNLTDQVIRIIVGDETATAAHKGEWMLGTKNKLTSIDWGGGDTGGGNVTNTFNYTNQNTLTVLSEDDPKGYSLSPSSATY